MGLCGWAGALHHPPPAILYVCRCFAGWSKTRCAFLLTMRSSKKQAGNTTVRAESRRLFVENLPTKKGEFVEEKFIVNKRSPRISAKESVKVKDREKSKLDWDDRLTIEINGDAPVCESIRVEAADPATPTIFLCGNSTVVDQENEPWASWGQMLPRFLTDKISVANHAESGLLFYDQSENLYRPDTGERRTAGAGYSDTSPQI